MSRVLRQFLGFFYVRGLRSLVAAAKQYDQNVATSYEIDQIALADQLLQLFK
jgi:hypothetical protein